MKLTLILALSLFTTANLAHASEDLALQVTTEEVATPAYIQDQVYQDLEAAVTYAPIDGISPAQAAVVLDQIINMGKKVWDIIEKGRPVATITYDYANALPKGIAAAGDLEGFSDLKFKSYRVSGKNFYGMTVYDVTYTLVHQFGGSYDGQGQYLSTVSVIPSNVDVLWGYTVDYKASKITATNVGSSEEPVAAIAMELKFKVSTVIKSHSSTTLVQFRGDRAEVIRTRN